MLEAFAHAGHDVWFVDPRLDGVEKRGENVWLVPSVRHVPARRVILFTHYAPLSSMIDLFDEPAVVYDILDDLTIYDPDEGHLPDEAKVKYHHDDMVDRAAVVTVSNPVLGVRHTGGRTDYLVVENGVDLSRFSSTGAPAVDLGPDPVVGYHGAIAEWFDFELVEDLASKNPSWRFVLVGPVYERVSNELARLLEAANVVHYPKQSGDRIPAFVRGFDVGIIPFRVYDMTEGVTPLKMYEYMACRVPVVSTPLPACVDHPAVATSSDPIGFASEVATALAMGPADLDRLETHAREAAWSSRLAPVIRRLDDLGLRIV
jgi:glycosyltransferase involved in cell wall biosynthesis